MILISNNAQTNKHINVFSWCQLSIGTCLCRGRIGTQQARARGKDKDPEFRSCSGYRMYILSRQQQIQRNRVDVAKYFGSSVLDELLTLFRLRLKGSRSKSEAYFWLDLFA